MHWVINYYVHQSEIWKERRTVAENMGFPGGVAYADRKIAMWMDIKSSVEPQFRAVNPDYQQRII
jgi:hypothetical protein